MEHNRLLTLPINHTGNVRRITLLTKKEKLVIFLKKLVKKKDFLQKKVMKKTSKAKKSKSKHSEKFHTVT